ncbi:hypothetical protein OHC33_001105 [Knufia fluminis]|uniref:Uncharacterized protein n=1 Tax=Knufia fluminis TaxID=191047 RepID=A0AAN8EWS7_9EURO|nr:hypothetical protein OHC33_001105 [Knufia fluminis]
MSGFRRTPPTAERSSWYSRRPLSIYLAEPFSSQSLASTLVDYTSRTSSTAELLGYATSDEASLYEHSRPPPSTPNLRTTTTQKLLLRSIVFLSSFTTHGLVLSFGQLLAQDLDLRWGTPIWASALVGSLQLSSLHASVPLARVAAQSKWQRTVHLSVGVTVALLTALQPRYSNIVKGILLQGVLQGLLVGMYSNTTLYMALTMKYDHATAVCASLGAPIGGAIIPFVIATVSGTAAFNRGFGLWLLLLATISSYALRKLAGTLPRAALKLKEPTGYFDATAFRWPQLLCMVGLCLAQLALYIPPLLLPFCSKAESGFTDSQTGALLTTFWLLNASAKLVTARGKFDRHDARRWIVVFSMAYSVISIGWCFVRSTKGLIAIAAASGWISGCWLGTYTSAIVELLGPESAAASQVLLNILAAMVTLIGLPSAAALMDVGRSSQVGPAAFTASCFGLAGLLFWLSGRGRMVIYESIGVV